MDSTLKFVTYNFHGYNQSYRSNLLCNPDIVFGQEHWLPPYDLDKLKVNVTNFITYSSSSMDVIEKDILRGRPFGGLVVYINNKYAKYAKLKYKNLIDSLL